MTLDNAFKELLFSDVDHSDDETSACDHGDVCLDERCCLDCGKDMTEELMARAHDRAKSFRKYGNE